MKKIILLFCAVVAGTASFAQTIPGGDMEVWRTGTAGDTNPITVAAPTSWYGADSIFIGLGETLGAFPTLNIPDTVWHQQLFEESNPIHVHGGAHSARIMTTYQDTLLFPGTMSNSQANVHITFTPPGISGISFSGGLLTSERPTSVSAWVQYFPGKDSITHAFGGADTGILTVTAISRVSGTIGTGIALIGPSSSWMQITAIVNYTDTINSADTMRINFASSGGARHTLDSSILYADDVTMASRPQTSHDAVQHIASNNTIKVYPNPATNAIFFDGGQAGEICTLVAADGQLVATKVLTGNDALNVANLPAGSYFYSITDRAGKAVQNGHVSLSK